MSAGIRKRIVVLVALIALLAPSFAGAADSGQHLFILTGGENMFGLDPDISFRPAVCKALGKDRVIIVKDAEPGAYIAEWDKSWKAPKSVSDLPWISEDRPAGHLYDRLIERVKAEIKGKPVETVTLVWVQGEADVAAGLGKNYGESLKLLLEQIRKDLKRQDLNFVIGRVNDFAKGKDHEAGDGVTKAWQQVREAQQKIADGDPSGMWVDTDDLNTGESPDGRKKGIQITDDVLLSYEGYVILGYRLAQRAVALAEAAGTGKAIPAMDPVYAIPTDGVKPASIFGHYMILQRGMPVPIWGTSTPKQKVTVSFAGHSVSTKADKDGKWRVELTALEASAQGRDLVIEGSDKVVLRDVMVGEVWICSGQSNMQFGWGTQSHNMYNWGGVPELAKLVEDGRTRPVRTFNVPCNVGLEPADDCRGKWIPEVSGSAVAFGFSYYLQKDLDVPVGVIVACWGSTPIESWMPLDMTNQLPYFKKELEKLDRWKPRLEELYPNGVRHGFVRIRQLPNIVYNGMMSPIIPYACRGMVWYQGEANANNPEQYAESLPLWVERLRKEWGRDDLEFLAVMLPGFGVDDGRPDSKSWALFREAQMSVLELPYSGVVNTVDLGEAKNIHPHDKNPVCKRISLMALHDVYGKRTVGQGPVYDRFNVGHGELVVIFKHAAGLKTSDGRGPRGFWLSGKDGKWYPAKATITGDKVFLTSADVKEPVACRYAFCGKPDVNLVNGAGLPAYPFRTDGETSKTPVSSYDKK